jgi:D-alanyl-D-alanine carboxypeptidase
MDPQHVDDVAKARATPTSRRKALQLLAGLAGASGLAALPIPGLERVALAALAQETPTTAAPPFAAKLQPLLQSRMRQYRIPGAIVYVDIPGQGTWLKTMGTGDLSTKAPLDANGYVRIGSITKTITATVVLQLVEEGKLHLDDPLSKYQPEVPNGAHITIRQLLNMTSGIFSYPDDSAFWPATDANPNRVWNPKELLAMALKHPPYSPPGQGFHYSDTNYILLGLIIEQITHQPVEAVFRQRVFTPLGMHETVMPALTSTAFPTPHPHGYQYGSSNQAMNEPVLTGAAAAHANATAGTPRDVTALNPSEAWTAGAVLSTLHDLKIWARALATGTLLTAQMQHERLSGMVPIDRLGDSHGLGIGRIYGLLGYNGQIQGFSTYMLYQPKRQATVIVLVNLTATPDRNIPCTVLIAPILTHLFAKPRR